MSIDDEIALALDHGDTERAAYLLAAKITGHKPEHAMTETFELEAPDPGHVPARVIDELRRCHREAKDYVAAFADATKAQAEKFSVKPGALRRYVVALEADKVDDVEKEIADLNRLIDEGAT